MSNALTTFRREKQQVEMAIAYVFREEAATLVAQYHGVSSKTVLRRLRDFGVRIRSTSEQRHCDRRHGRYSHSAAIKTAWSRGSFDTEAYQGPGRTRNQYDRRGDRNPFFGRTHSGQTKKAIREKALARSIPGIGKYGKDWTTKLRSWVMERDGYRCQVCDATEKTLQVHHVDHDRANNKPTNLLTVCAPCHLAYHGRRELLAEMQGAARSLLRRLGGSGPGVPE